MNFGFMGSYEHMVTWMVNFDAKVTKVVGKYALHGSCIFPLQKPQLVKLSFSNSFPDYINELYESSRISSHWWGLEKNRKKKTLRKTGSNPRGSQHIFRTFHFPSKMGKPATLIPKDAPNKKHFGNRDLEKGETHIENAHHLQVQVPFISKEFFSQVSDSLKNTTSASLRGSQKTNQFLCVILVHPLSPSAT